MLPVKNSVLLFSFHLHTVEWGLFWFEIPVFRLLTSTPYFKTKREMKDSDISKLY